MTRHLKFRIYLYMLVIDSVAWIVLQTQLSQTSIPSLIGVALGLEARAGAGRHVGKVIAFLGSATL